LLKCTKYRPKFIGSPTVSEESSVAVVASVVCLSRDSDIGAKFRRLYRKSWSPSKNVTSDFALEVAKYPKSSPNLKITKNGDLDNYASV